MLAHLHLPCSSPFLHRTQAQNPALGSIIRNRRVQVLPVQWRASLKLEQKQNDEDKFHGLDNTFTMEGEC